MLLDEKNWFPTRVVRIDGIASLGAESHMVLDSILYHYSHSHHTQFTVHNLIL